MARQSLYIRADVKGFDELIAKFQGVPLYANAWRRELTAVKDEFLTGVRRRAPHRFGGIDSAFLDKMDSRPMPEWAYVSNDATASDGFRYGWALDASKKTEYHYASGPRKGRKTLGWFTDSFAATRKRLQQALDTVAQELLDKWQQ
ncbi:MAG TPA: hypothetical protein VFH17_03775 [Coriobacteriia bacterium]|nr:hypothetical protein [Coriobacteriia bacterium]